MELIMKTGLKSIATLFFSFFLLALASAQENVDSTEETIVVTATRQPTKLKNVLASANVITRGDIERINPRDVGSLLNRVAGLSFRDSGGRGSVGGLFIRGATPGQSVILVDGMRVSAATVGLASIQSIPVDSIERIEIVKGPLSGLYGADAVGGVIQIFTKSHGDKGIHPEVTASFRTDDTQKYSGTLSGENSKASFNLTVGYEDSQGFDRTSIKTGGNADRDEYDEININFGANVRASEKFHTRVGILRADNYSAFDNTFGADSGFDSKGRIENSTIKFVLQPSDRIRSTLDVGYFKDELVTPAFNSDITTRRSSVSGQTDFSINSDHTITLGLDYYDEKVSTLANFEETSRDNLGGFFQWQGKFTGFSFVGNLRFDDNQAYGDDFNGSIAIGYQLLEDLSASASFGTAFRAPSFNDLFFPFFGTPTLNPEESESVELALSGEIYNTDWRLSAYHNSLNNLIGVDPTSFTAANITKATLKGVEFEFESSIQSWIIRGNLNYLDAKDDITNEYLDDRAKFSTSFEIQRSFGKLGVNADIQAESGRHDLSGVSLKGHAIAGIGLQYRLNRQVEISSRIDNLWDEKYTVNLISAQDEFRSYGRIALFKIKLRL